MAPLTNQVRRTRLLDPLHRALDRPPQLILPIQCRGKGTRLLTCIPTRSYYGEVKPDGKAFIGTRSKFQQWNA
jgi:hypothetical protein